MQVLIVHSNELIAAALSTMVRHAGHDVLAVESAAVALKTCRQCPPGLVILGEDQRRWAELMRSACAPAEVWCLNAQGEAQAKEADLPRPLSERHLRELLRQRLAVLSGEQRGGERKVDKECRP